MPVKTASAPKPTTTPPKADPHAPRTWPETLARSLIPFAPPIAYVVGGLGASPSVILFALAGLIAVSWLIWRRHSDALGAALATTAGVLGLTLTGSAVTAALIIGWLLAAVVISPLVRWLVVTLPDLFA